MMWSCEGCGATPGFSGNCVCPREEPKMTASTMAAIGKAMEAMNAMSTEEFRASIAQFKDDPLVKQLTVLGEFADWVEGRKT